MLHGRVFSLDLDLVARPLTRTRGFCQVTWQAARPRQYRIAGPFVRLCDPGGFLGAVGIFVLGGGATPIFARVGQIVHLVPEGDGLHLVASAFGVIGPQGFDLALREATALPPP